MSSDIVNNWQQILWKQVSRSEKKIIPHSRYGQAEKLLGGCSKLACIVLVQLYFCMPGWLESGSNSFCFLFIFQTKIRS